MDTLATSGATPATPPAASTPVKTDAPATPAAPAATPDAAKTAVPGTEATGANTSVNGAPAIVEPKYELKAPEGYDGDVAKVVEFAKANKISEEAAQKFLEYSHEERQAVRTEAFKAGSQEFQNQVIERQQKMRDEWRSATESDREIGGHNLEQTKKNTFSVFQRFDQNKKIREMLNESGRGNDPDVVRFFNEIGKAMGEGRFIVGAQPSEPANAQSIYSKSNMKP
jgi:hypothetical protein